LLAKGEQRKGIKGLRPLNPARRLDSHSEINNRLENLDVSDQTETVKTLKNIRVSVALAMLKIDESSRSRNSSLSSAGSLGSRIADYDKEFLYTYRWGLSEWSGNPNDKADFQQWLEGGYKLPPKNSVLNCWEATIVNLYLYNAFDKNDLIAAFVEGKKHRDSDGTVRCIESDADIVAAFLGFDPIHKLNEPEDIQAGDIVSFESVYGTKHAHVAITFEGGDAVRLASFWTIPEERMMLVSPDKLVAICAEASQVSARFEGLDMGKITISKKFRSFFQSLVA